MLETAFSALVAAQLLFGMLTQNPEDTALRAKAFHQAEEAFKYTSIALANPEVFEGDFEIICSTFTKDTSVAVACWKE